MRGLLCSCPVSPGPGHGPLLSLALWKVVTCKAVHLQPVGTLVTPAVHLVTGDMEVARSLGVVTQSCLLWKDYSGHYSHGHNLRVALFAATKTVHNKVIITHICLLPPTNIYLMSMSMYVAPLFLFVFFFFFFYICLVLETSSRHPQ